MSKTARIPHWLFLWIPLLLPTLSAQTVHQFCPTNLPCTWTATQNYTGGFQLNGIAINGPPSGTGVLVLQTSPTLNTPLLQSPTLVTPQLGVAVGTSLALGGGTPLTTTNQTGTGSLVLAVGPTIAGATLSSPSMSNPSLGVATGTSLALGGGTPLTTTNQTGTGSLVLATSPTITTPTISTPAISNPSVTGGTFTSPVLVTPNIGVAIGTSLALGGGTPLATTNQTGTGSIVLASNPDLSPHSLSNILHVPSTFAGSDIGAQINTAYASLPSSGGVIVIDPTNDGSCYSYSTPIVLSTAGKSVRLEAAGVSQAATGSYAGGACLNYTPTSGNAITLDYVGNSASAISSNHGLKNISLQNNGCIASGGCGGTAVGIMTGTVNQGTYEATMENISVSGFAVGYENTNPFSVDVQWFNAQFFSNVVASIYDHPTGIYFHGGVFAGNQTVLQTTATGTVEVGYLGTEFFGNSVAIFDFSNNLTGSPGQLNCINCHIESGASASGPAHFVTGVVDTFISGGLMEDDGTVGTGDWMINASGNKLITEGVTFLCARTCTTIAVLNSPVRTQLGGYVGSPGAFTNYVTGANISRSTVMILAGPGTTTPSAYAFEGPLSTVQGLTVGSGPKLTDILKIAGASLQSPFTSIAAQTCQEQVITVTGALTTGVPSAVPTSDLGNVNLSWSARPSAGSVVVRICNPTIGAITPSSVTWNVTVPQ